MNTTSGTLASYTVAEYKNGVFGRTSDLFSIPFPVVAHELRRKHGHIVFRRVM